MGESLTPRSIQKKTNARERRTPMKSIKGPAIFLAQFAGDETPFNTFDSICGWAASLGYKGVQIPAWDGRFIDLKKAADSISYCQELVGSAEKNGVEITELATHLQGQLVAVNPVYDEAFDALLRPKCAAIRRCVSNGRPSR